jgi:hypothetical protein
MFLLNLRYRSNPLGVTRLPYTPTTPATITIWEDDSNATRRIRLLSTWYRSDTLCKPDSTRSLCTASRFHTQSVWRFSERWADHVVLQARHWRAMTSSDVPHDTDKGRQVGLYESRLSRWHRNYTDSMNRHFLTNRTGILQRTGRLTTNASLDQWSSTWGTCTSGGVQNMLRGI